MSALRFLTTDEAEVEELPWGPDEWFARPGLTDSRQLMLVRGVMPPGEAHQFHRHPAMEEILYYESGRAEQWVGEESQVLTAGDVAHIPMNEVFVGRPVHSYPGWRPTS